MSFLLLVVAVVALYYGVGVLRWDHENEYRVAWPPQPPWLRWRLSLRPGRVLQCGQARPGGLESVAAPLPLWLGDDLRSVAAGLSLSLTPRLDGPEGDVYDWAELTGRRVDAPEECVEVRLTREGRGGEPQETLIQLRGSRAVCDSWAELFRSASITDLLERCFDVDGLRHAVESVRRESAALRRWSQGVAIFWFALVPTVAAAHALLLPRLGFDWPRDRLLLGLLGLYLVLLATHHLTFWRLSTRWFPGASWTRIGQLLMHTISPADAMLCLGPLSARRIFVGHPVTQALSADGDVDLAARLVRSLHLSRPEDSLLKERVLTALDDQGFDWCAALAPPERESPGVAAWCPSCREQFVTSPEEQATCPDCADVELLGFES